MLLFGKFSSRPQIQKMRQKIFAVLVTLTIICSTIYLYSEIVPPQIATFVDYYRQHVYGGNIVCGGLWERINYTEFGFTQSPDFGKYTVPMYEHLNWTSSNMPPCPIKCPACTNLLLKEAVRSTHQIPFNGTWLRYVVNNKTDRYYFHPHFCSFSEKALTKRYVRRCLAKKNIRKLVTIGDSNSWRLMEAIVKALSTSLDRCKFVAIETSGIKPDPKYYLRNVSFNLSDVSFLKYLCSTCASRRFICSYNTNGEDPKGKIENRTLELEHIGNTRIIDGSRRIITNLEQFLPTNISQEFLLRDYFRVERYPDIILYQTSFAHEINSGLIQSPGSTGKLWEPLKKLRKLITKYVPLTTSIYWLPNQDICESDPRASFRNPLLRESIDVFSEEMESILGSSNNNIFPFFDLFELSRPIKSLHKVNDPSHMKPEWYEIIAKYILELHCNS